MLTIPATARRGRARRHRTGGVVALVTVAAVLLTGVARDPQHQKLFSHGVVAGADGTPVAVAPGSPVPAALRDASVGHEPSSDAGTLAALGRLTARPAAQRYAGMRAAALRDLDLMVLDGGEQDGAVLAGIHGAWRFSWTRDSAWVSAALAVSGRSADALRVLDAVNRDEQLRVGRHEQGWQARYRPDGSATTPDDRGAQLDGPGWVLWATSVWAAAETDPVRRRAGLEQLRPLVVSAATTCLASIDPATRLPRPSMDYWELPTSQTSLGIAAPVLAGLRAAGPLLDALALPADAAATRSAATSMDAAVRRTFGAQGYSRLVSGGARDTSAAWLTPPFGPARADQLAARDAAYAAAMRPVGGVAPGGAWREHTVAWTPSTSAFALSFAGSGDRLQAMEVLDWLDRHRTGMGSLPEKVGGDGLPASVAPLSWTAAAVLLTIAELDGDGVRTL